MPVDHKRKLIFVHIPKNAGTSIEKYCDMNDTGHHNWKYYFSKYLSEWNEYTSFAVIRDPIDRFISCYRYARMTKSYWHNAIEPDKAIYGIHPDYKICSRLDINSFCSELFYGSVKLKHPSWSPQHLWIIEDGEVKINRLVSYENIDKELEIFGIYNLPKKNFSQGSKEVNLSDENKKFMQKVYSQDYKLFDLIQK